MIELADRKRDGVHVGMLSFWAPNENFVGLSTIVTLVLIIQWLAMV